MDDLMLAIERQLGERNLAVSEAAARIGVGVGTLRRHLDGEYVRSDSAAKYRRWLSGVESGPTPHKSRSQTTAPPWGEDPQWLDLALRPKQAPQTPHRVVDLFSGCGGLSLGFEMLDDGAIFSSTLAVDVEQAMLDVLDGNRKRVGQLPVGRRVDLSDLTSEAEVLAFYLDHIVATHQGDARLERGLESLPQGSLMDLKTSISTADARMAKAWSECRTAPSFRRAVAAVGPEALKQTSVLSFHTSLRLPHPSSRSFSPPLAWWDLGEPPDACSSHLPQPPRTLVARSRKRLEAEWNEAVHALRGKAEGVGRGQLASSARRIRAFLDLIDSGEYDEVREAWLEWRSLRDSLRLHFFVDAGAELRALYEPRAVDVVLGGPPCQGFSRIGRGKLRSLRESGVQAHSDDEAGDERNRLLFAYVLVVSALRPKVFLFENVRHFQAEVRSDTGTFRAEEVLEEAIGDLSGGGVSYAAASRVILASHHGVPQTRERYFMIGVRDDYSGPGGASAAANMVLNLPVLEEVDLLTALQGLPLQTVENGTPVPVSIAPGPSHGVLSAKEAYTAWIRKPFRGHGADVVDSHHGRQARTDDEALFKLMGPGTRWMDYRVADSPTITQLRAVLEELAQELQNGGTTSALANVNPEILNELLSRLDGSLALRLLLEQVPPQPGELSHHLLSASYLGKKEGNHGDWLARLAADRPCKTITSHMGKDTYRYIHPVSPRTLTLREAARVQTFPDWYSFSMVNLVDGFRIIGNAVPPLLSACLGHRVLRLLDRWDDHSPG